MMLAPGTGCALPRCESSASAGGQLEHPSEVNSSTRTGVGVASAKLDATGSFFNSAADERAMPGRRTIRTNRNAAATKTDIVLARRLIKFLPRTPPHFPTPYSITEEDAPWMWHGLQPAGFGPRRD